MRSRPSTWAPPAGLGAVLPALVALGAGTLHAQGAAGGAALDAPTYLSPRAVVAASLNTDDKAISIGLTGAVGSAGSVTSGGRTANLPGNTWVGLKVSGSAQGGFAGVLSGDALARDAELRLSVGHRLTRTPRGEAGASLLKGAIDKLERAEASEDAARRRSGEQLTSAEREARETRREAALTAVVDSASRQAGWLALTGGVSLVADLYGTRGTYVIADSADASTVRLRKEALTGLGGVVGLGAWTPNLFGVRWVAGASVGVERANNVGDLTEVRVDEVRAAAGASGPETRVTQERKGLYGAYAAFTQMPVGVDLVAAPIRVPDVALHLFTRTPVRPDRPDPTRIGLGVYLLKDRNPLTPLGGLTFRVDDAFRVTERDDPRFSVGLIVNVPLPRLGP